MKRTCMIACAGLWIGLVFSSVAGQGPLYDSRVWHGKNGKHFRGKFLQRDGEVLQVASTAGKVYNIPITSLSESDQKWFNGMWQKQQVAESQIEGAVKAGDVEVVNASAFAGLPPLGFKKVSGKMTDRKNIPVIDQSEYYDKDWSSYGSALVPFIMWWHASGVMEVPSRRDDNERRIKNLYKDLNKTEWGDNRWSRQNAQDLQTYLKEELKAKVAFRLIQTPVKSPEHIAKYTQHGSAVIMPLTASENGRGGYSWNVPVKHCDAQGNIEFSKYGLKLEGKMTLLPPDPKAKGNGKPVSQYRIEIKNPAEHPDWFKDREYVYTVSTLSSLVVLVPYLPDVEPEDAPDGSKEK
ncbi:hypothetical protein HW115_06990 [Verrucomicrobiaceae bacterium N1E253]|uniref:SLA1 homology domain-containing protein n=1 Tax=Oceaniferula marina TaxID=2748318 RepID=A0A851GKU7_9BACT|nr:hypothetical protein [Oceaniferula marina]NWK55350.1 hypothetical protein [Oceaniferula marina]